MEDALVDVFPKPGSHQRSNVIPEGKLIIWFWLKIMQTNTFFDFKYPCTYQKGEARKALWELIFMELSPVWSVTEATVLFFQTFS